MTDYASILTEHAKTLRKMATFFEEFQGTDCEDHCDNLSRAAHQFDLDAEEYVEFNAPRPLISPKEAT